MAPRGSMVDAPYSGNPSEGASYQKRGIHLNPYLNTIDSSKRRVNQKDINYLHLERLNYNNKNKANLGNL